MLQSEYLNVTQNNLCIVLVEGKSQSSTYSLELFLGDTFFDITSNARNCVT
jgi:hypothetical protein